MAVIDLDRLPEPVDAERLARQRALSDWHAEWFARQVAAGVDGPVPPGRAKVSDWNLHVPDMIADAGAEDEFHARAREIMGITGP